MKRRLHQIRPASLLTWCLLMVWAFDCQSADTVANRPATTKRMWNATTEMEAEWGKVPVEELRRRAEQGEPEAQHYLAWRLAKGVGMPANSAEAATWFQKAAAQGFALAQNNMGALYSSGTGVSNDYKEAITWFKRAADQGLPLAMYNLADLAASGKTSLRHPDDTEYYLKKAADLGNYQAATELGRLYFHPGPGRFLKVEEGIRWLSFAADNGHVDAYADLGCLYLDGNFVPKDYDEAERWYTLGAEKGDARCQLGLAMHELAAHPEAPDLAKARKWMQQAADAGLPAAYFQLGRLSELQDIEHTPEISPNYEEAAKWYQQAADAGLPEAAGRLAKLAIGGHLKHSTNVISLLQRGADMGNRDSQLELALRYWRGDGKPRNAREEPETLIRALANGGYTKAEILLADLYRTGKYLPKDPLLGLHWLHCAATPSMDNPTAYMRLAELKEAVTSKRKPSVSDQGFEQVYDVYRKAMKSEAAAAQVGKSYLNGTYPTNQVMAYAWFSLAAEKGDSRAASERDQVFAKLNENSQADAKRQADMISYHSRSIWPGEEP
jgi:TPR repeat protein